MGCRVGRRHDASTRSAGRRSSASRSASSAIRRRVAHLRRHDHARPRTPERAGELAAVPPVTQRPRLAVRATSPGSSGSPRHADSRSRRTCSRGTSARCAANGIRRSQQGTIGADVKYGLTSNLTLDGTINPDFGQVEADPAQLNLTAFETFFEERRPFFLEGRSIFLFGADPEQLFYSRRIGRAPQLTGLAPEGVDVPGASRILGAGKLTGRVAGGTSLGVLAAMTDRTTAGGTTIEPRTTFGLARAMRDLRGGESAIGVMVTAVDRALDAREAPYLRRAAYAAGVDGRHRFGDGRYEVTGSVAASSVRGSAEAIARTQRSSVHQYQRPDDALIVDTTRTSLDGTSFRVVAKKVAGVVRGTASYQRTTPGYETNDFGFLERADEQVLNTNLRFIPTKPIARGATRRSSSTASTASRRRDFATGALYEAYVSGSLKSGAYVSVDSWVDNAGAVFCDRCARGGPALRVSPTFNTLVNLAADPKRRVSPQLAAIYTLGDGGRSLLWRVRPYVIVRPSTRLGMELGTRYQYNRDNTQWIANVGVVGADTTHYLFGRLYQDLLSFTGRSGPHDSSDAVAPAVRRAVRHGRAVRRRTRARGPARPLVRRALPSVRGSGAQR